jgi:hypothetical protein
METKTRWLSWNPRDVRNRHGVLYNLRTALAEHDATNQPMPLTRLRPSRKPRQYQSFHCGSFTEVSVR